MRRGAALWLALWFSAAAVASFASTGASTGAFTGALAGPTIDYARVLAGPARAHWLGYDAFGRDLFAVILAASFRSAAFAALATALSLAFGLALGCALAFARGGLRFAGAKALAGLLAFPSLLFALAWAAIRGPGWGTLVFALLIGTAPAFTRYVQARADDVLREDFVSAARSLGATERRVFARHLLPALMPYTAIKVPNLFASALLAEATLSFLGVGAPIGDDTWGSLLAQGREYLIEAPHIAFAAGVPLVLTVLALQLLSESQTQLQ